MTTVWIDRMRHYFISSARSSVNGSMQERIRWRQNEDIGPLSEIIALVTPEVPQTYFKWASHEGMYNRCRQ